MGLSDKRNQNAVQRAVLRVLSMGVPNTANAELRRRAQLTNGLCIVGIIFLLALGVTAMSRGVTRLAITDFVGAGVLVLFLAVFWLVGYFRTDATAGVIFIGAFFLYLFANGGEDQSAFVWIFVFPLVATFLQGANWGLATSGAVLVLAGVYFVIDPMFPGWADYSPAFEIRFSTAFLTVSVFAFIYERMRAKAIRDAELATAEARRASEAKSHFLARVSHELRTPLNHIIGFSSILKTERLGALSETQREYLGDVLSSGHHLLGIIDDLLDLSRIDARRSVVDFASVDLCALVQESRIVVIDQAEAQNIEIETDVPGEILTAEIDARLIRQVLYNLLQNAVKFTGDGGTISLSLESDPAGLDHVVIRVSDNGAGIEAQDLEHIFDEFYRGSDGGSTAVPGSGLGLSLCRRFIELHNGTIEAESEGAGRGATFTIRIPREQPGRTG